MKRLIILISAALLIALLAGGLYRGAVRALSIGASLSPVPTTTIKRGDLTLTVAVGRALSGIFYGAAYRAAAQST
jgi:hypothetical protein